VPETFHDASFPQLHITARDSRSAPGIAKASQAIRFAPNGPSSATHTTALLQPWGQAAWAGLEDELPLPPVFVARENTARATMMKSMLANVILPQWHVALVGQWTKALLTAILGMRIVWTYGCITFCVFRARLCAAALIMLAAQGLTSVGAALINAIFWRADAVATVVATVIFWRADAVVAAALTTAILWGVQAVATAASQGLVFTLTARHCTDLWSDPKRWGLTVSTRSKNGHGMDHE